jgi:hypothetical protein
MNANDILKYGHLWVHKHLDGLTEDQWLTPNVCGFWSTKDIIAHLTSYEWVLVEVLGSCVSSIPTPTLDQLNSVGGEEFNTLQVGKRQNQPVKAILDEYNQTYEKAMQILPKIPKEDLSQAGTIPWYGSEYSLDDLIVYQYYGHKREHCAQIAVYRDTL